MRILIVGGTLFIGRQLAEALVRAGHDVTVLHRNLATVLPAGVRGIIADRNDAASVAGALKHERFDAVFDNVYDWERGTTAGQVASTAQACLNSSLKRYVFMSSVAAYGAGLHHGEDDPLAPDDDPDLYVRNKASSERALFAMKGLPAVTIRPGFVYGPGNPMYREAFFWDRIRDGRAIIVPDDGSRLMHFSYVKDIVWCCLRILEVDAAVGRAFNIADGSAVTQADAVRSMAQAAHTGVKLAFVPREKALAAGGSPMGPKFYFAMYFDMPPITMRIDRARTVLGFEPTNFHAGLQETYDWWQKHNPFPKPDYSFEDSLCATH
jgi:nucleoside-diphosphate-sugar epimerase